MRKALILTTLLLSVTCLVFKANVKTEASEGDAVISYYYSIADYFAATQKEVTVARDRGIPADEIPVVFFMSRLADVSPVAVMDLRLSGKSWLEVANTYGFESDIYYFPINDKVVIVPPYGKAYGYYKNKPKKEWYKAKIEDDDIINLVNLEFISEYNNYPPGTIMAMRGKNRGFNTISDDIDRQREVNQKNRVARAAKNQPDDDPDHLTGTKKQVDKLKKFFNKKERKANMYINDKG